MLTTMQNTYFGVPIVTRSWLSLIVAFAGLTQLGVLPAELVALDASAVVNRLQLWRLLTAGAFFGGVSAQLLQKMFYLVQFGKGLEITLGTGEFLRVLVSCAMLLSIVSNVLGMQFIGDGLIMAVTVLTCQQAPEQPTSLYGLQIPTMYLPFAQLCMSYMFTQQIPWNDILGALVGYVHYNINSNMKPDAVYMKYSNAAAAAVAGAKRGKTLGGMSSSPKGGSKKGGSSGGGGAPRKKRKSNINTFAKQDCGPGG